MSLSFFNIKIARQSMKKIYLSIILTGLGLFVGSFISFYKEIIINPEEIFSSSIFGQQSKNSKIIIYAVGDVMLDRGVEYMVEKEGEGDFRFPFLKIAGRLKKADILFGNLEGPVSERGNRVGSIYSFRSDPKAVEGLDYAGFDVLSLANNHMLDYGRDALEDTMNTLKTNNIDYVGAGFNEKESFSLRIKKIKNIKIGFMAFTDLGPSNWRANEENSGMSWVGEEDMGKIEEDVRIAKEKTDILVVSLHSGNEYDSNPTVFQEKFSRSCIDAGADIILGHHPHVVQKVEKYQNGWIAYSLGNFVFDQFFSEETMKGALLEIIIINGKIKEVNSKEVKISQFYQPYLTE